ncbi:laminin EGF domain-containing protein [Ditylenchus destructor]|uniref:Laminin EGF domain-containing protein n=1 Tax=Ditylenchus destructor TaxID=166010 RepID=A0AAD4R2X4_9BILA|nr:laminin EGF domain-containing protein [Ditylenchus destructor]
MGRKPTWATSILIPSFICSLLGLLFLISAQPNPRDPPYDPHHYLPSDNPCYDDNGNPQRCVPDFINAAFNLEVEVTNTCGERQPTRFCVQTGHMGVRKNCDVCDARQTVFAHPASYLTDFNNPNNETWWQSETMAENMQYPNHVNLTLRLGKAFDITYVRLKFISPRPESFQILKKEADNSSWIPWQYYSGSCRSTYKLPEKAPILPGNEAVAQCTREFSDISPLTGGNIAFPTLEGRPSAENFEESEILQSWVTAVAIRIVLNRMNTFGDEIFGDPRVLRSYYYAISDFAVGGRCKCNGHASQCVKSTGRGEQQLVCDCKHHTTGVDCGDCEPFYVDRPWRSATSTEANECLPCNCNNLSQRCFFDKKLFEATGHGGHCVDCAGNTKGPHCEQCVENHWRRPGEHYCVPCQCNEIGSEDGQCDESGQCKCKPGVTGQHCDQCQAGFYEFSTTGCKDCQCNVEGSFNNTQHCSPIDGTCACKANVEGQRCDKCKPGYFNLASENQFGCTPCFCYGHSSVCSTSEGYYSVNLTSNFLEDVERWTGGSDIRPEDVQWAQIDRAAAISQIDDNPVYFYAPSKYTGDQRLAYNQDIVFTLRVQQNNPAPSKKDVVIVGANGLELSLPIFAQGNPIPSTNEQTYKFHIHANSQLQWNPTLREIDFIGILSNVSAIKVRGTYSRGDVGFLSNFRWGTASLNPAEDGGDSDQTTVAEWVETCKCTEGFVGQFCESCAPGYRRALKFGGPLTKCIRCECHGHSDSCDAESGACICQHDTAGDTCERCARGYYGDALNGTENDCKKCDCPENGPCILLSDGDTICTECPEGYTGRKCENCANEFFGNPLDNIECRKCDCSSNTDPNSIGNCDTVTGECRKCIYHTSGFNCEKCASGYWGDALAEPKGDQCRACSCYAPGTQRPSADYDLLECRQSDGQCSCLPNVVGTHCDQCEAGFYNLTSGSGCHECDCDPIGSLNGTCDVISGQCFCKVGVTGRRCDQCAPRHFGFGSEGCRNCECDEIGSETPECDVTTGQCLCKDNVEGRRCDQCSENRFDMRRGCLACDDCYTLIQTRKNSANTTIAALRENLDEIRNNPVTVDDSEFDARVDTVKGQVQELHEKASRKLDGDDTQMRVQVDELKDQLQNSHSSVNNVDSRLAQIDASSSRIEAELRKFNTEKGTVQSELENAIGYVETEGQSQLTKAQKAADRYGDKSQKLSDLATEAKQLVDGQESRMKQFKTLSENTRNSSKQALNEANEAIFGATSTSQLIANLNSKMNETDQLLKDTQSLAEEQQAEAAKAYDQAARILSNVESIKLPQIIPDELREKAKNLKEESQQAVQNAQQKAGDNQKALWDAQQALQESRVEFNNLQAKQNEAERLLSEIEQYQNRAKEAFDQATKIWNEAKDSHDALSDFHEKVQQSKEEALAELANLPEIEKELNGAESTTKEAEEAVGDARYNANQALKVAEESKIKADNLIQESNQLGQSTDTTKEQADARRDSLDNLANSIDSLATTTKDFENQALSDAEKSQEVLKKATLAESSAKNLQERLAESEKKLLGALDQLNSLENVDDNHRYSESQSETQLKERIRKAELDANSQKRQIDALIKDLENLRSIRDTLPTKCYNLINLEQEGQK